MRLQSMDENVITVLLIDDDAAYASVAQHLLRRFQGKKFKVIWKEDGDKAIAELTSNPEIDVVLMDYYLPNKNGVEITKELAAQNVSLPIIFLTTSRDFRVAVEAMKCGVEDYLVKDEAADTILPRTIINVLERVKLKKQIADAEKQKLIAQKRAEAIQELIVAICHEFNNPMAAIKISADIISRQNLSEEERALLTKFTRNLASLEKEVLRLRDIHWDSQMP